MYYFTSLKYQVSCKAVAAVGSICHDCRVPFVPFDCSIPCKLRCSDVKGMVVVCFESYDNFAQLNYFVV